MKHISSRHHPLVAACRALARGRSDDPRILLDGLHLVDDARRAKIRLVTVVFSERTAAGTEGGLLARALEGEGVEVAVAPEAVIEAMSPVSTPSGVVALAHRPTASLEAALVRAPQLVILAADVQDPGNVGAIARAAEAGGATGAAFCGACADPFGWKALRGSMGSLLRLPVAHGVPAGEAVAAARRVGALVVAAAPRGGREPHAIDLGRPVAFLLGGEGPGLPPALVEEADERVTIPMQPPVESLNVAVAAALLVYEAARQRKRQGVAP